MFAADEGLEGLPDEEKLKGKPEKVKPLIDKYWLLLENMNPEGNSGLKKAIVFSINQRTNLNNYLLDQRLELTNNRAERAVKPFVIGRKNWLFSDTDKGAEASARCYSIIETAKLNNLDIFAYLTYLLTELPKLGETPTTAQLDSFLPWSPTLPEYCK
ncbi:MAG: transposase [Clostridiales bacterium]|nr:transposase [Clostridiales bacterium]